METYQYRKINGKNYIKKLLFWCLGLYLLLLTTGCGAKEQALTDGTYVASVTLEGGSGRATVESPAKVSVVDGKLYATIRWSSPNYDYMMVEDTRYENEAAFGENSTFTFPIKGFDEEMTVIADTTAMSVPHEIEYTLTFTITEISFEDIEWQGSMRLSYATQFSVQRSEYYDLITIVDSGRFLLVKENSPIPVGCPEDVVILQQPLDHIYLVASSVVDLYRQLGCLEQVSLLGIKEENLYIEEAVQALQQGRIVYAGKYSAPDYELILQEGCDLAIENTMIYHNPQVKEKLEQLGIPVWVERSSYENHPLGRMEWIRLYGILMGKEQEADAFFTEQIDRITPILDTEATECKVAYFSINSNGVVNVRKPNDYIAKMIALSGGSYALSELSVEEDNALSTMNMQMEEFYVAAKDADILIYNSTIEGEIVNLQDLLDKNPLFADFSALQTGNLYCTSRDFFQESTGLAFFMEDLYAVCHGGEQQELHYLNQIGK